jgi:hypothetical protein
MNFVNFAVGYYDVLTSSKILVVNFLCFNTNVTHSKFANWNNDDAIIHDCLSICDVMAVMTTQVLMRWYTDGMTDATQLGSHHIAV